MATGSTTSSTPCPQGFVSQELETTSTATLEEIVGHQLIAIPSTESVELPVCQPLPTATVWGEWITVDDCLAVSVTTGKATSGLVLTARVLACDGSLHYLSYGLDKVPVSVRTTITLPLTPGYLIDLCVSNLGSGFPIGVTFVSVYLQHTCAQGIPPSNMLAQGYVSDLYVLGWPSSTGGGPVSNPTALPGPGQTKLMQHKSGLSSSGTVLNVTYPITVSAGSCLIGVVGGAHPSFAPVVTDTNGNTWSQVVSAGYMMIWISANARAGATQVHVDYSANANSGACQLHIYEIAGIQLVSPVDVSAQNSSNSGTTTATTASTSFADITVVGGFNIFNGGGAYNPQAGYTEYEHTQDVTGDWMTSLLNLTNSTPPAQLSFTLAPTGYVYVVIAGLIVA